MHSEQLSSPLSHDETERLVALRRKLHRKAELSFHEVETAAVVMAELDDIGIAYEYAGEGSGVIARQMRSADAPTVALRAELDALPGRESTGVSYTSSDPDTMHACGHDAHLAMLLAAARRLKRSPPAGNVVYVFQPAEEYGGGARTVIDAGALRGVEAIFAGHVSHEFQVGEIMVASGVVTSQSDRFSIEVAGEGGHAARPHEAIDAVVVAGFLITALQTLVSREVNPLHPSVVTIGRIAAGSAPNVIADSALLEGSIRTTLEEVRDHIHDGIRRMAEAAGLLHGARVSVEIRAGYPAVVNTLDEAMLARESAAAVVGEAGVKRLRHPSMGSEDFSFFLKHVPGCYVRFGARSEDWEPVPLHSSMFNIDERVLPIGARYYEQVARDYTRSQKPQARPAGTAAGS